jgi:acetate kinase
MLKVLICNAGSTFLKFKLWGMPDETVLAAGRVERIGMGARSSAIVARKGISP